MTTLTRWEPFREMTTLSRAMDRMFDRFVDEAYGELPTMWEQGNGNSLAVDVAEKDGIYEVKASVPGIQPEDIEVTLNDNVLTIKGEMKVEKEHDQGNYHLRERRFGSFTRRIALPSNIDVEKIEATNENGVLTLTLPKAEAAKPKRIEVKKLVERK